MKAKKQNWEKKTDWFLFNDWRSVKNNGTAYKQKKGKEYLLANVGRYLMCMLKDAGRW